MSNPGEEAPVTLIEQNGEVPETVTPDNTKDATPVEDAAPKEDAEKPAEKVETAPKRVPWYQQRIDEITKARREAERKLAEAEARLAIQPKDEGEQKPFDPKDLDPLVNRRAEELVQQREYDRRAESWIKAGQKDFGPEEFNQICADVSAMGAGDNPIFMQIITDSDVLPEGHKVLAQLRDNPDEAQRIINLPPIKMAAALAAFSARAKPEAAVSKAPAPIKPIGGAAKSSTPDESEPIESWMAKRRAEVASKRQAR
jgi:hypothetical protein